MNKEYTLSLKDQWKQFRAANPKVRIRDAARQMGTTEAEILAGFAGSSSMLLNTDWAGLVQRLPELGYVMVLTRNEHCVHERKGVFENISVEGGHVGVITGKDIDLRMFLRNWAFGFVQFTDDEAGFKESIQVFDRQGVAIIKIYLQANSDREAFQRLVRDFSAEQQETVVGILPAPAAPVYNDDKVDIAAFRTDWGALKDTHEFFGLLQQHKVSRMHALHIAGDQFAQNVSNGTVGDLLDKAAAGGWEIMVFVGNKGNIQIHTGGVMNIVRIPGWINVMDPSFNLHLKLDSIAETWVVVKPTTDGPVHSLELYDNNGEMIVQFFGKRKPGIPENTIWQDWIKSLMRIPATGFLV